MQLQVYYSITDQMLHGNFKADTNISSLVQDLQQKYYCVEPVQNTVGDVKSQYTTHLAFPKIFMLCV